MRNVRVGTVQMEHAAGDKSANFSKIEQFTRTASAQGVEILVFPECCITGYWHLRNRSEPELLDIAESVPDGPSTQGLLSLASQYKMTIGAGLVEIDPAGKMYNSYVVA